jgi:serine/threonine protein phosphatase PrpC
MSLRGIVTQAQAQGTRDHQEDRIIFRSIDERYHLLGIADGHGGPDVAELCAKYLTTRIMPWGRDTEKEFRSIFQSLVDRSAFLECGSTLSLAWIDEEERTATTATIGDSPIIVRDAVGRVKLTEEHNARTNLVDREAAFSRGGKYDPDKGYLYTSTGDALQLTRALGDRKFRSILSREPSINKYALGAKSVVIVASDGIFDSAYQTRGIHNLEAGKLARLAGERKTAEDLLAYRTAQTELDDNTSIIMWRARRWWEWF